MQALGVEAQEKATARAERFRGQAAMLEETVAQQQQSLRSVVASLEADVAAERARGGVIGALLQGELTADDAYAASREQVWFHAVTCRYTSYVRLLAPRRESRCGSMPLHAVTRVTYGYSRRVARVICGGGGPVTVGHRMKPC